MERKVERWRDERKRGMYNRMEQCYLLLSLAIPPSTSSSLQWSKQSMQKEKRGGMVEGRKIEEEGGSFFPSL